MAELTAAMISHSMGFDSKITDNSAAYLDSWIGVLKKEPKFIVSIMADVNKASDLILDHVDKQRLVLGEQPYLAKNDPFAPLGPNEEVPFKNAAIIKTRSGDYAIRASYDGEGPRSIRHRSGSGAYCCRRDRESLFSCYDRLLNRTYSKNHRHRQQR